MLHEDRARAGSFGAQAERYDRARPGYPPALVDALLDGAPRRTLDVGCGTGIAGRLLAERGCDVLGLEPDPRMAAVARSRGLTVEEGALEAWDARGRTFALLTAAQAWHWVEPVAGARRAAELLEPGGRIGLFWNLGRPPVELKRRFDAVYAAHAPGLEQYSVLLGNADERFDRTPETLSDTGDFGGVEVRTFPHDVRYTTAAWLETLPTHSDHARLEPAPRDALFAGLAAEIDRDGGAFTMRYDAILVTALRR